MVLFIMVLLIFVRLPSIYVTSSVILSKVCGAELLTYSSSSEHELFYINGVVIDKLSFCQALQFHKANECFSDPGFGEQKGFDTSFCGLDVSLHMHLEMPRRAGRKILLDLETKQNKNGDSGRKGRPIISKHDSISLLDPKVIGMALPGMFILCCCLLCPCFRSRPKETSRTILTTNNSSSMDTCPPSEVSSGSENIPGPGTPFRVPPSPSRFSISPQLSRVGSVHLNISQVMKATQNFSPQLKIGEGGFGTVYRAQLQDGQIVAIKRAKKEYINTLQAEFSSEVQLLAKIEHRSLVRLLGYVDKGDERIIITEHVPNGTLREHLDGQHGKILDFYQRLEISIDVAHALTYLHLYAEKQIIHRDVKSSNILLTESFRAKVADFGFARLGPTEDNATHILTKVRGTAGYLDPEYLRTYQLTPKSDVYSFGILLTEILTGRRPVEPKRAVNERVTIRWAFANYNEGNVVGLLDPLMKEVVNAQILSKIFCLAFQCAAPTRLDRPNMKEVGEQLWLIRKEYLKSVKRG